MIKFCGLCKSLSPLVAASARISISFETNHLKLKVVMFCNLQEGKESLNVRCNEKTCGNAG